jgi:hypothetical protein
MERFLGGQAPSSTRRGLLASVESKLAGISKLS